MAKPIVLCIIVSALIDAASAALRFRVGGRGHAEVSQYNVARQGPPVLEQPPPPLYVPTEEDVLKLAASKPPNRAGALRIDGAAPLVPKALADRAAELARQHVEGAFPGDPVGGPAPAPFVTTTTEGPRLGPPRPPLCAVPPNELRKSDVQMALKPFRPANAVGMPKEGDDGLVWKLKDGGWAWQNDDLAASMDKNGITKVAWKDQKYSVEVTPDEGISYHKGDTVIHRGIGGDLVYHQPTGTIHQEGDTVIYHWCDPNLIVYHTPTGLIYYDDDGMTYRGSSGLAHYGRDGDLTYQGVGGVTRQKPDGSVTHWTESGAIFRHADGMLTYTPVGEKDAIALAPDALGPDPYPGPPLTIEQVLQLAQSVEIPQNSSMAADSAIASAAAAHDEWMATATTTTTTGPQAPPGLAQPPAAAPAGAPPLQQAPAPAAPYR